MRAKEKDLTSQLNGMAGVKHKKEITNLASRSERKVELHMKSNRTARSEHPAIEGIDEEQDPRASHGN